MSLSADVRLVSSSQSCDQSESVVQLAMPAKRKPDDGGPSEKESSPPAKLLKGLTQASESRDKGVNAEYLTNFANCVDRVRNHKFLKKELKRDALTLGEGGRQSSYSTTAMAKNLKGDLTYKAGINFLFVDSTYSTMHGIPYNQPFIQRYADTTFKDPTELPFALEFEVEDCDNFKLAPGARTVSPEEIVHAQYWALLRDIDNDKVMKQWLPFLLSTSAVFKVRIKTKLPQLFVFEWFIGISLLLSEIQYTNEFYLVQLSDTLLSCFSVQVRSDMDPYIRTCALRQSLLKTARVCARDTLQTIMEVIKFKEKLEIGTPKKDGLSVASLVKHYKTVDWEDDKERISEDYIKKAIFCWKTALSIPEILDIVRWMQGSATLSYYAIF